MKRSIVCTLVALTACGNDDDTKKNTNTTPECPYAETLSTQAAYCSDAQPSFTVTGPCTIEVETPARLLLTTTDNSTGSLDVVDVATNTIRTDVQSETSDSIPFFARGVAYVLSRFGFDRLDVLDGASLTLQQQISLSDSCATSVNPQSVAVRDDGVAFIPTYGDTDIQVIDVTKGPGENLIARVPMQQFADADGIPELSLAITCGDVVFVSAQRLDRNNAFAPTDYEALIPVDMTTCAPAPEPMHFLGHNAKQARADRSDANRQTALVLTTGIERVNLATLTTTWAVSADAFAANGISGFQIMSFDVADADTAYVAAYTADFASIDIWKVALDGSNTTAKVISGLNAVEKTLEIIGTRLYFGDTTAGREGVREYDISVDPPTEGIIAAPLGTGLPPYSMIAIP